MARRGDVAQAWDGTMTGMQAIWGGVLALLAGGAWAQQGFDANGVRYDSPDGAGNNALGLALAIDADGGFFAAGWSLQRGSATDSAWLLKRYLPDGSDDPAFTAVRLAHSGSVRVEPRGLLVQPDGHVVAALTLANALSPSDTFTRVLRFTPDGATDPAFTPYTLDPSLGADDVGTLALQLDGKILAAGSVPDGIGGRQALLLRLHPDGTLDTGFGNAGFVRVGSQASATFAGRIYTWAAFRSVNLLPDGRIFAAGDASRSTGTESEMLFVRYLSDGTPDPSLNGGEPMLHAQREGNNAGEQNLAQSADIGATGIFVIGGTTTAGGEGQACLLQFAADGEAQGSVCESIGVAERVGDVQLLPDGGVIAAGFFFEDGQQYGLTATCGAGLGACSGFVPRFTSAERDHALSALAYDPWQHRYLALGYAVTQVNAQFSNRWLLLADDSVPTLDLRPEPLAFPPAFDVALDSAVESDARIVAGISVLARLPVRVADGRFSANGLTLEALPGAWPSLGFVAATTEPARFDATLGHRSAATPGLTTRTEVEIGGAVRSSNLALTVGEVTAGAFESVTGSGVDTALFDDGFEAAP